MIDYTYMNLGFGISALLICFTNIIYTIIQGRTAKPQHKYYVAVLTILVLNSITGVITSLTETSLMSSDDAYLLTRIVEYVYFITHTALCPILYFYISTVCGVSFKENHIKSLLSSSLFVITEIFVLINPWFNFVYYFDENRTFQRNWAEGLIYIAAAVYFTLAFVFMIRFWDVLAKKRKTALIFFFLLVAVGVVVQLVFKHIRIEVLAEAMGFTGLMMGVENEDDRINATLGIYNRSAFDRDLTAFLKHSRTLTLMAIRITNLDIVSRMTGSENTNALNASVAEYLKKILPVQYIYTANPGCFMLTLFDTDETEVYELASDIRSRFDDPWECEDTEIPLSATILITEVPGHIRRVSDAFYMLDTPIPSDLERTTLEGDDLEFLLRRAAIESAVSRGLDENSFEVYYQPTYNLDGSLHGAEALLRMHDSQMGNLFPDEFIPVAEQIGLIGDIDDFVLEEVCRFAASGIPAKYHMDCINVNLSVLQCMKPDFVEHITEIVERSGVDKGFINFEITESVAADDYRQLSKVVTELKNNGFLISMDDYGTGYSNMNAIFSMNFDVIKIDKSILWSAEKGDLGHIILENSVRMIRQIKKKILVEGVETEKQLQMLRDLEVDYLQGYYYSKPIPKDEFIALIGDAKAS